jgi:beta-N-acetylhexosaminidase
MKSKNRRSRLYTFLAGMLVLAISLPVFGAPMNVHSQTLSPAGQADQLLNQLTPEERIGQLFLVTFQGTDVGPDSQIYDLIHTQHLGGVVLLARNDNIVVADNDPQSTPKLVASLIRQLQQTEWEASLKTQVNPDTGNSYFPAYIPLFAAISQEGDGVPFDQILNGLTQLPNAMALGATWNPDLAAQVGNVLGQELSALGINFLLGPSLDVLDVPKLEITNNLGTRTFGGDPYWVGEMGRAYIRGVHQGSNGKLAVAAKHFPGYGGSDRLPEEEVATVRKGLDELKSFDLAPFLTVTGNALSAEETSDALLTSHIRYQGLQGNIRATTRPVSLDPQALALLLELPGLANWRENAGLLVSDDLGNMAVRRFYDLISPSYDARRVALNAFLAGNDLLYIADFSSTSDPDSYTAALHTLAYFAQKYREDAAFAQRVDESVKRILTLKFRLYPSFSLTSILPDVDQLTGLGQSSSVTFDVARKAATLLSPTQAELDTTIPDPPNQNDRIVFISDTRTAQQCSTCIPYPQVGTKSLQEAVLRLYGPQAGGLVTPNNLSSYSFDDLSTMLSLSQADLQLERDLIRAHWIVMVILGDTGNVSSLQVLKRFLSSRPDLFQQKRLIVFALTAPYYLDATNISKLTAYYCLYSKVTPFIDAAAYLLFGELRASGSPPVSVAGIGYNLNEALFPDPATPIPLEFDLPPVQAVISTTATVEPTPAPEFRIGDVIPLRTGVILDHNGNAVPDGTPVDFLFTYGSEANSTRQSAFTQQGVARTTYSVTTPGTLEILVESENARSAPLKVDIPSPSGDMITPSPTPQPTETPTLEPPTPTPEPVVTPSPLETKPYLRIGDWLIAVLFTFGIAFALYRLAAWLGFVRWGVRVSFFALIGGLIAYTYLAIRLPGSEALLNISVSGSVIIVCLIGSAVGLGIALAWRSIVEKRKHNPTKNGSVRV